MVEGAITNFCTYLNLQKRFSPLTVKNYHSDLAQFFSYLEDEISGFTLQTISHHHLRGYIAKMMDSGLAAVSVNRKLSSLKSFFKYLLKNQVIEHNPTQKVQGPKKPKR